MVEKEVGRRLEGHVGMEKSWGEGEFGNRNQYNEGRVSVCVAW